MSDASNSGPWGPVPAGIDLSQDQNSSIIGSVAVVMAIGLAAVTLRLIARVSRTGPGLGTDDYVVLVASILGIGNAVCCLISIQWGGGKHLWVVTTEEFIKLWQTTYAFVIVYINSVTATKSSILLFYRRMFGATPIWYIVFGLTIAHGLEVTITWLSGCRPVSYFWKQYTDAHASGSCIDASVFYFINGIIGLVIDVSILLVPIPTVYKLKLPARQKLLVCGILLLGSFVCVASAVRIVMMNKLVHSQDFTWAMCQVFIWSCVEPFVGILCACLPTYAPLVRRWYSATKSSQANSLGSSSPYVLNSSNQRRHHWDRIRGPLDTTQAGDDELELTTKCGNSDGAQGYTCEIQRGPGLDVSQINQSITVTQDFSWSRSA